MCRTAGDGGDDDDEHGGGDGGGDGEVKGESDVIMSYSQSLLLGNLRPQKSLNDVSL